MTKEQFLKLIRELKTLPPDITIKRQYVEKFYSNIGLTTEHGYKAVQYFYEELCKAKNGEETIFRGRVVNLADHWGIVDHSCYFKSSYDGFDNMKELFQDNTAYDKPLFIPNNKTLADWILADSINNFKQIENELYIRDYIDNSYKWLKNKTDLVEFLCVLIHFKYFKPIVLGKRIQDFHKRHFISQRYGYIKTGLSDTWKKKKPEIESAIIPFYWVKKPE